MTRSAGAANYAEIMPGSADRAGSADRVSADRGSADRVSADRISDLRVTTSPLPPLTYRMSPEQYLAMDVMTAVIVAVALNLALHARGSLLPAPPVMAACCAATLPVAVRRLWPLPVLAVVVVAVSILTGFGRAPLSADLVLGMASYMAALRLPRLAAVAALIGSVAAMVAGAVAAWATGDSHTLALHSVLAATMLWFVGRSELARRTYLAGVVEQETERQRAEADRNRRAVREERVRIARELHDILAHTLSVVTVQAGVGRRVGATRPAEALHALRSVEESSRGALDQLRRIVGLLRSDGEPGAAVGGAAEGADVTGSEPVLAPAPGLANLGDLAATVRAAGTPVALDVTGDPSAVPPAVGLTVYRIVQEALTNVVRHAPGAQATVRVRTRPAGVQVRVTDTGDLAEAGSAGHGILGMRERAVAFGGTLEAGSLPGGGFRVAAFLPVPGSHTSPDVCGSSQDVRGS
jgi:signal transduction histidine kinase